MVTRDELRTRLILTGYRTLLRPALFTSNRGDAELIHRQTVTLLAQLPDQVLDVISEVLGERRNPIEIAGIDFPGRVGLAAGVDKDAEAVGAWASLGFGFAELGTVTAHAQPGNRLPRLFRAPHSHAIINRMGFNNAGAQAMAERLQSHGVVRGQQTLGTPLGISIGKTKTAALEDAVEDYLVSFDAVSPYADYIAINVSSPNTPGLRTLQDRAPLEKLVTALVKRAKESDPLRPVPLFVKLAPDMTLEQLVETIDVIESCGASGIIATNTTTARKYLHPSELELASQAGGLSGAPLTYRALEVVESVAAHTSLPIMASGGIMTPQDAQRMFDAGASLVQVYTGFIYQGPALVLGINSLTHPDRNRD